MGVVEGCGSVVEGWVGDGVGVGLLEVVYYLYFRLGRLLLVQLGRRVGQQYGPGGIRVVLEVRWDLSCLGHSFLSLCGRHRAGESRMALHHCVEVEVDAGVDADMVSRQRTACALRARSAF